MPEIAMETGYIFLIINHNTKDSYIAIKTKPPNIPIKTHTKDPTGISLELTCRWPINIGKDVQNL